MLNFAILSAGNIAGRMARTLDSLRDEVQPYAIAARDSARAQALAGRYGFAKSFAGYEALLADPAVDVVYIGSIHPLHAQHIRAALLAGKHVLCEKPMAATAQQARQMFRAAEENGVVLNPILELGSSDLLVSFAEINLGLTYVIEEFTQRELQNKHLFEIPVEPPVPKRSIGMVRLKNVAMPHALKGFIDLIEFPKEKN